LIKIKKVERKGTGAIKYDGMKSRFGRDDLLPLWVADMDLPVAEPIQSAILKRAQHPIYSYTLYEDSYFDSIIKWYKNEFDWDIEREWIVPEHGVVVSINLAIRAFSKKGDGILIQTPIYPPFTKAVNQQKRTVLENRLLFENGETEVNWDDFRIKAKDAKMFLLCSPHNPSTRAWSKDDLQKMIDICVAEDVIIVSDEIHSDFVFNQKHIPIGMIEKAKDITITLHAPSKTFNIAGLNTSFVIIPNRKIRDAYIKEHSLTGLEHGNPFGLVAAQTAYTQGKDWLEDIKVQLQENAGYVKEFLSTNIPEIIPHKHDATFLIWLDCRALNLNDDKLIDLFVNHAKLALNSGISFGEAGSGFMRLNIATDKNTLEEAMKRLDSAIKSYLGGRSL